MSDDDVCLKSISRTSQVDIIYARFKNTHTGNKLLKFLFSGSIAKDHVVFSYGRMQHFGIEIIFALYQSRISKNML